MSTAFGSLDKGSSWTVSRRREIWHRECQRRLPHIIDMFEMGPPGAACHSPNEIPPECVVTLAGFREPSCTGSGATVRGLHLGNAGTRKRFLMNIRQACASENAGSLPPRF